MTPPQWALVTGVSAGGMGEGHVRAFLERGISVFATSIDTKLLDDCKFNNGKNQASTIFLQLDVTNQDSINAAVKQVESITAGRLDFLMNNAGFGYFMPLLDVDLAKAKKQYEVNVWGVLAVTQAFFPLLRTAKGTIVNQSSMAGVQGFNRPYMSIYNSSKAAVYSMSDNMRVEFAPFDVKVVTLVTGAVKTEFYEHKEKIPLPSSSVYSPIRKLVETQISASMASAKGHDRFQVTRSTIANILRYNFMRTNFIRRGWGATKIWLLHLLMPVWLIDRWARQAGNLDKLKRILQSS